VGETSTLARGTTKHVTNHTLGPDRFIVWKNSTTYEYRMYVVWTRCTILAKGVKISCYTIGSRK